MTERDLLPGTTIFQIAFMRDLVRSTRQSANPRDLANALDQLERQLEVLLEQAEAADRE